MNHSANDVISKTQSITMATNPEQADSLLTRNLNQVVHKILVVGLLASAMLMLIGLGLDLILNQALTAETLQPDEALRRALALRPSGFFSLGLIMLMLTPLLRVVSSVLVFIWEHDWRYAGVTILVLFVMLISVWVGMH
jgi:uncharacterized membrane protein